MIKFKNVSHLIDNECNLNNYGEFSQSVHVIYPHVIQLKCENYRWDAIFLDLETTVINGIYEYLWTYNNYN